MVEEGDPILSSAVEIAEDVSKVLVYENMNNAINVIDVEDYMHQKIPRHRQNTDDQINDSNPF